MLKNWTVKTEQIKYKNKNKKTGKVRQSSPEKFVSYLLNKKHSRHLTTNIVDLKDSLSATMEIEKAIIERKIYRKEQGLRGGAINNPATSFDLVLPKDVKQPTVDEWREIGKNAVRAIAKANGLDAKEVWKKTAMVLHEETDANKKSHITMMVGNIYDNLSCKGMTQLKTTYAVKESFNASMLKIGVDHKQYTPQTRNQNKPLWLAREEKQKKALVNIKNFFESYLKKLRDFYKKITEEDQDLALELSENLSDLTNDLIQDIDKNILEKSNKIGDNLEKFHKRKNQDTAFVFAEELAETANEKLNKPALKNVLSEFEEVEEKKEKTFDVDFEVPEEIEEKLPEEPKQKPPRKRRRRR